MRTARNSVMSQLVGLALAMPQVSNAHVQAALGCNAARASSYIHNGIRAGHLVQAQAERPKLWALSPARREAIATLPNLVELRARCIELMQFALCVCDLQKTERKLGTDQRKAALASAAIASRAARTQAKATAIARATHQPSAAQRPPELPGTRAACKSTAKPGTGIADAGRTWRTAPVQDPKGLLQRPGVPAAAPAPFLVRGGHLAPSDGPYIRPDGRDHLAAPSRRGDARVAHRPPLSQP